MITPHNWSPSQYNRDEVMEDLSDHVPQHSTNDWQDLLQILSEEFDTLGLPPINLKQSLMKLLHQVANNAHLLIQMYRKTLLQMKDLNINNRHKETKNYDLEKKIHGLDTKLKKSDAQNKQLENNLTKLNNECSELKKIVTEHNKEMKKIKCYHKAKQNELTHQINNLTNENQHLKEICGKDVGKYYSKDDKVTKVLTEYRHNEEIYKATIKRLEENNGEILKEVYNLRELLMSNTNNEK